MKVKKIMLKNYGKKTLKNIFEWKDWCIRLNRLPEFFGTRDNPIAIHESKL